MTGHIIQISASRGGLPKRAVQDGFITPLGLEGDQCAHPEIHGGAKQAILVIAAETVDELKERGYPVFYGALGENLTTRGLDRRQLRLGQRLRAGGAVLELTKVRVPCGSLDIYGATLKQELYDKRVKAGDPGSPRWGMSGFYASVIEPGPVQVQDIIAVEATLA
jgi:MOSC domain-containing protein YiiM